jgi:hypothetical protein
MTQEIKLPPLPETGSGLTAQWYRLAFLQEYATAAVKADRAQRGEPSQERKPMTKEDADNIMKALNDSLHGYAGWGWIDVIRAVEAFHGIKP